MKILEKLFVPIENSVLKEYSLKVEDHSLLTPLLRRKLTRPLIYALPRSITPLHLSLVSVFIALAVYIISIGVDFSFAPITFPIITVLLLCHLVTNDADGELTLYRGEKSHLREFLDHYLSSFSLGFISIAAIFLFTPWQRDLIPIILITFYAAAFAFFLAHRDTGVSRVEKYGQFEMVCCIAFLALISALPPVKHFLTYTLIAGLSLYDLILLIAICGSIGMTASYLFRDRLYLTPEVLLYLSSCVLLYIITHQVRDPILSTTLLIVYHTELIGRLVLARMASTHSVYPRTIPLLLTVVGIEAEPFIWYSYWFASPLILYAYLVMCNVLLAVYGFMKLR